MRNLIWRLSGLLGLLLGPLSLAAQQPITWDDLADVKFSYVQNFDQNFWYGTPDFGPKVQALAGKEVQIKGYVLPLDVSGDNYVLSAFPFSTCFFCGGAGQESVMELRLKNPNQEFSLDAHRSFRGVLRLNDRELELNYILEEAEPVGE